MDQTRVLGSNRRTEEDTRSRFKTNDDDPRCIRRENPEKKGSNFKKKMRQLHADFQCTIFTTVLQRQNM